MFRVILQTASGILNSLICTAQFSGYFNSVFNKKSKICFVFVQYSM